jgi:hypothetical protein
LVFLVVSFPLAFLPIICVFLFSPISATWPAHLILLDLIILFILLLPPKLNTSIAVTAVRVPGYRSKGPGCIPGATRFSEKYCTYNGVHSTLLVQLRSYMKGKVAAQVSKAENMAVGICCADHALYPEEVDNNSADNRGSLRRYSSLSDSGHGV